MLETKCVGDNFEILMTVLAIVVSGPWLAILVTCTLYLLTLASGTNIPKKSARLGDQVLNSVAKILKLSPTVTYSL